MEKIDANIKFPAFVEMYQSLVFSICLKMTGDYFAAEDLTQEAFLSAYVHWSSFDGSQPKAWICRIASNLCVDYHRQAARRVVPVEEKDLPQETAPDGSEPLHAYLNREVMEDLGCRCDGLGEPYAKVARMHFIDGLKSREIAERMGRGKKTVDTWIYRAREMLKKQYGKERDILA